MPESQIIRLYRGLVRNKKLTEMLRVKSALEQARDGDEVKDGFDRAVANLRPDARSLGNLLFVLYYWRLPVGVTIGRRDGSRLFGRSVDEPDSVVRQMLRTLQNKIRDENVQKHALNLHASVSETKMLRERRLQNDKVNRIVHAELHC